MTSVHDDQRSWAVVLERPTLPSLTLLWILLFQVEPNTKLFPAVFIQPTNQNMAQLELGKLKVRANIKSLFLSRLEPRSFKTDAEGHKGQPQEQMPSVLGVTSCLMRVVQT